MLILAAEIILVFGFAYALFRLEEVLPKRKEVPVTEEDAEDEKEIEVLLGGAGKLSENRPPAAAAGGKRTALPRGGGVEGRVSRVCSL